MQNLSPVIKKMPGLKYLLLILFLVVFLSGNASYCQIEQTLPEEFQSLSTDLRALSKKFKFTLDSTTTGTSQSFVLDKTGFILHLAPSPKIKDENTKIKIFSSNGAEVQTYKFIDDTIFALVDPQETYSICEEIMPKCDDLIMKFGFEQTSVICPDTELFKLNENIMIDKDTSFKINLRNPAESYSAVLSLPQSTQFFMSEDFSNIKVSLGNAGGSVLESKRAPVNIAGLLPLGNLCFVAKKKNASMTELTNCSLVTNNVSSIITFKNSLAVTPSEAVITVSGIPAGVNAFVVNTAFDNAVLKLGRVSTDNGGILFSNAGSIGVSSDMDLPAVVKLTVDLIGTTAGMSSFSVENILDGNGTVISGATAVVNADSISTALDAASTYFTDKDISMSVLNVLFSFITGKFNFLSHSYVFELAEDIKTKNQPVEINSSSSEKYLFENNSSNLSLNLGPISTVAKKNKKNIFTLSNPIVVDKTLSDISFAVPLNKADALTALSLNGMSFDVFLDNIALTGNENMLNVYNLSANNNIVIKNQFDLNPLGSNKQRFQAVLPDSLLISSYLPDKLSGLTVSRDYTFVEQVSAPSVDDKGKPIEVINNKSKADLILAKNFLNVDLSSQRTPYTFAIERTSTLLNNKLFTMQGNVGGFLLPPDFRPVLEDGYRAGVEFTMTINLINDEVLKIVYADLKTKDETLLTNFFTFSFLPLGEYDVNIGFDSDRIKLFQKAGVIKPNK